MAVTAQMLVVFKSAPILKRALKVKQAMMQLYVLKLLKVQTKYLGRQWRKSNMKTMSAIYQKVRHRLNDDWAYGNGEATWETGLGEGGTPLTPCLWYLNFLCHEAQKGPGSSFCGTRKGTLGKTLGSCSISALISSSVPSLRIISFLEIVERFCSSSFLLYLSKFSSS